MITIECLHCGESVKTRDVLKAVAFDREHKDMHPVESLREALNRGEEPT